MTTLGTLKVEIDALLADGFSPETKVFLSADEEGNSYGMLDANTSVGLYDEDEGVLSFPEDGEELGSGEEVIVFWPIGTSVAAF